MVNKRDTQYLLLTPGPLSTTRTVREAMMQESSTWDVDYNGIVQSIRSRLVRLAVRDDANLDAHTAWSHLQNSDRRSAAGSQRCY